MQHAVVLHDQLERILRAMLGQLRRRLGHADGDDDRLRDMPYLELQLPAGVPEYRSLLPAVV